MIQISQPRQQSDKGVCFTYILFYQMPSLSAYACYCPFDITQKAVFCLTFYFILNDNILFWLTISYQISICLFCFCFLFSNIYSKIKFTIKYWSNLWNFYTKVFFGEILSKKIFFTFLCWIGFIDVSQQFCENVKKIEQADFVEICLQVTYPTDFCIICIHFYYGKKRKYLIFFKMQWLK